LLTIPAGADFILRRLMENGFDAYVVGGCVRDSLLGLFPHDWDICTSARPEQMQAVFADCRVIETGLKHGTLTVLHDRIPYEVTTFRVDGGYTDHRHPDSVSFVSNVVDDLARRDFTVNAMAWNPQTGLVDAFHGQEDLRAGIIRAVGDPKTRFTEDALRILRALRFASVYGFQIDDATSQAAHDLRHTLTDVAAERIRVELAKLLCGQGAADILRAAFDVRVLCWNPRRTAAALGMRTEASGRFEKGLDPMNTVAAVDRACELVELLGCGEGMRGTIDVLPEPIVPKTVKLEPDKVNGLLGTDVSKAEMRRILLALGFELDGDTIIVPSWRGDVEHYSDIAEDRYPHIRDTECAEHEDDHFDRERDPDILVDDAHSLSGYLYRRREL